MNQTCLPLELSSCLKPNHIVFTIHEFIESLSDFYFDDFIHEEGRPSYNPRVLVKVLLFAYSRGIFSGRKMEEMMVENLAMQWLTGQQVVSYRTINRFRSSDACKQLIENLFIAFTVKLKQENMITLDHLFIDGTKIEANANKFSFVWRRATEKYAQKLNESIRSYFKEEIQPLVDISINEEELEAASMGLLEQFSDILAEEIDQLSQDITENPVPGPDSRKQKRRRLNKHLGKIAKDFMPRREKYDHYNKTFNGRNSFSKTDPDATFMRMKDDHMMNGQLKPGYNLQIGTENQFVLHYDIFPNPTDTRTLIPFIESAHHLPKQIVADAGYGSEENLDFLNNYGIDHLIKYGLFDKEQKKKFKLSHKNLNNWSFDEARNEFTHPEGVVYRFKYASHRKNRSGFNYTVDIYAPDNPDAAPQKNLYFNKHYQELKQIECEKLLSTEGSKIFAKRKIEVEPVFGQIKANLGYTRCNLRSKAGVKTDTGLVLMANNFKKYVCMTS